MGPPGGDQADDPIPLCKLPVNGDVEIRKGLTHTERVCSCPLDPDGVDRVFVDLKKLTAGSHLMGEVVSLYNISTTQSPHRITLMELYFRKIFSLVDEDYLLTKEINEEIKRYVV